ncbi:MAG TPA: hypothetical protein VFN55_15175 [Solirubrobacteraceae bacterium]|nr:hypothetical protein [Solirubrobacteraceae bacterium]
MGRRIVILTAVLVLNVACAAWAAGVSPARGATRTALIGAFVRQDGSNTGIKGVFVSGTSGVVCQKTPDAGLVRFVFHRSGAWRFAFSTRGTHRGNATQRRLESACR